MRSAMCAIGRYDTSRRPSGETCASVRRRLSAVQQMLAWSSITPFGGPVVPEV